MDKKSSKTCIYQKKAVLLRRKTQNLRIMTTTQPTFNQVLDLAYKLPLGEQQQLIDHVQGNLFEHLHRVEETPDELKARLREAHKQAMNGEVYSRQEAHEMMCEYVQQRLLHRA